MCNTNNIIQRENSEDTRGLIKNGNRMGKSVTQTITQIKAVPVHNHVHVYNDSQMTIRPIVAKS